MQGANGDSMDGESVCSKVFEGKECRAVTWSCHLTD